MRVMLIAGGSGGHIYPCLELAKYFKDQGETILLGGSNNSLEEEIYKNNVFDFFGIDIDKKRLIDHFKSYRKIKAKFNEFKPEAIILFGNYISISFALVAIFNKIPIYLHEQNVIYGSANKLLGVKAKRIYLSLPIKKDIYSKKSLLVGNPKSDVSMVNKNLKGRKYNVVIAMGSLGSMTINKLLKELVKNNNEIIDYHLIIGKKYYKDFKKDLKVGNNIHLYPYLENLSSYLKSCDIFVSRAGATTISEITSNGIASILIPSPYVKNNHQYKNAKYLLDNKACVLLNEEEINIDILNENINKLINNYNEILKLKFNAKKLALNGSKKKIYEDIINDFK